MDGKQMLLMAAKAAELVDYDPETGSMKWRQRDSARWNARYAGKECGTINEKGYRRILFRLEPDQTFRIQAHRLAWFICNRGFPSGEIDHINQIKTDNRISNLRDVTRKANQRNRRVTLLLTLGGVTRCASEWAEITGIKRNTIFNRVKRLGWGAERALTEPIAARGCNE